MTSALSQVGPGEGDRLEETASVVELSQRQDRRVHVLRHDVGVAAVQPVVEVVPELAVSFRASDDAGEQGHAVRDQEAPWFGQQREIVPGAAELVVDDVGDRVEVRHVVAVADWESAADVDDAAAHAERLLDMRDEVEGAAQRRPIRLDRRALAADVKAEPREFRSRRQ